MSLAALPRRVHMGIAAVIATVFFLVVALAIVATPGYDSEPVGGAEDFGRIADGLFHTHVVAFLALGVLLTAALIGAMVIARPLGSQPDSINYATRRDASGLAEVQLISDVERNLSDGGFAVAELDTPTVLPDTGGEEE